MSIPRVRIKATTKSYDGMEEKTTYIPTPTKMVRAGVETVNVDPGTNTNVFTAVGVSRDNMKMNRRFTLMRKVSIIQKDGTGSQIGDAIEVDVNYRPDNRNQIARRLEFTDNNGNEAVMDINGHVDYEKGNISFQTIPSGGTTGHTYECEYATFNLKFTPVATMNGRTKVSIETEMTDVTIDPCEDFLID